MEKGNAIMGIKRMRIMTMMMMRVWMNMGVGMRTVIWR